MGFIEGFQVIFGALTKDMSVWWFLAPMLLFWLILEIYHFKSSEFEDLAEGEESSKWSVMLLCGVSLCWITIFLIKQAWGIDKGKVFPIILILIYSLVLIMLAMKRNVSDKFTYLGSPTIVFFLGAALALWVFGGIDMNIFVFFDLIILAAILFGIVFGIKKYLASKLGGLGKLPEGGGKLPPLPKI